MDDVSLMIYNELVELRNTFKEYADRMEERVSSLEAFKSYVMGIALMVGFGIRWIWDYIKERII